MRKFLPPTHLLILMLAVGGAAACSSESGSSEQDGGPADVAADVTNDVTTDITIPDTPGDAEPQPDAADAETADVPAAPYPLPELLDPVPLRVGTAGDIMPIPLGMPICGNFPSGGSPTAYSVNFPGTVATWMHPTIRVIALEGGTSRLLFVRMDMIGVNTYMVERVTHGLIEATGYDWTGKVIFGATHTHSGPGRFGPGFIWDLMADKFFPEMFDRLVKGVVSLSIDALLDLEPGKMGYGVVETDELHNDRRCENPELMDPRIHMLRFDGEDGSPKGLLLVHTMHGTVMGASDLNLSRDVAGGVEDKVKEAFDAHVEVLFFQSGGGDISPGSPAVDDGESPPEIPHDHSRIEKVGELAANFVLSKIWDLEMSSEVPLDSVLHYVLLSRDALGYADGEFPYEGGGAYCGGSEDAPCWTGEPTPIPDLDKMCLDILMSGEAAPDRTILSAARLGDLLLVTFPGEPVTQIAYNVEDGIRDLFPEQTNIVVAGYSQDYAGYSTPEWDFWQGGYEASGAIYGPKQGDYLTAAAIEVGASLLDPAMSPTFEDPGPFPLLATNVPPLVPPAAVDAGNAVTQPAATMTAGETAVFEFNGGDPWHLLPLVVLEKKTGGEFAAVLKNNQALVDSRGYEYRASLAMEPTYKAAPDAEARTYTWRFELPTDRFVESPVFPMSGTYRFRATGEYLLPGAVETEVYEVLSEPFDVQ